MAQTINLHDPVFSTEPVQVYKSVLGKTWTVKLGVFTERSGEKTYSAVNLSQFSLQVKDPERFLNALKFQIEEALKNLPVLEENKT